MGETLWLGCVARTIPVGTRRRDGKAQRPCDYLKPPYEKLCASCCTPEGTFFFQKGFKMTLTRSVKLCPVAWQNCCARTARHLLCQADASWLNLIRRNVPLLAIGNVWASWHPTPVGAVNECFRPWGSHCPPNTLKDVKIATRLRTASCQ